MTRKKRNSGKITRQSGIKKSFQNKSAAAVSDISGSSENESSILVSDFKPVVFTGMDVLDFLGKSVFCSSILALFSAVYLVSGLLSAERLFGLILFFALVGIPFLITNRKERSIPMLLLEVLVFALSCISAIMLLVPAIPLLPLEKYLSKACYRKIRLVAGALFFPLLIAVAVLGDFSLYYAVFFALSCMGLASALILMFPDSENDRTRQSFLPAPGSDKKEKSDISSVLPLLNDKPIMLHFQTPLLKFLIMILWLCAIIALASLFCWIIKVTLIPLWVTADAIAALSATLVLMYFSRACYVVLPSQKSLIRFTLNPLLADTREIDSQDLAGIVLGCSYILSGFFRRELSRIYSINLTFKNGTQLDIPLPSFSGFSENEIEAHLENYSQRLAQTLNCRFLNLLAPSSFSEWKSHQESFFSAIPGMSPPPFFPGLWQLFCESRFFDLPSKDEFEVVKCDLNTFREWLLLGLSVLFFAVTMGLMLSYEWELLIGNPRFFYLILIDFSSITVSVLALWRFFIDEYYLFDLNRREIIFSSRILFFRRKKSLGYFSEISQLVLEEQPSSGGWFSHRYRLKIAFENRSEEIVIGTSSSKEALSHRLASLSSLLEIKAVDNTQAT